MKYEITIIVDTNDADYRTSVSVIEEEEIDQMMPLILAIKEFKPYETKTDLGYSRRHRNNYPTQDCCREDLGQKTVYEYYSEISEDIHELFQEYCPWEEHGFHTVESIHITPVVEKEQLL
jgi:hypothetical protein